MYTLMMTTKQKTRFYLRKGMAGKKDMNLTAVKWHAFRAETEAEAEFVLRAHREKAPKTALKVKEW